MTLDELRQHWGAPSGAIRELPDGTVACLQKLMFTWSLVLGVDEEEWRYRFCYGDFADALAGLMQVQSVRDVPDGWVACRPSVRVGHGADERYPTAAELRELRAKAQA